METKMIDVKKVGKVYSGKRGCMCGCKGKWAAAPAHLEWANANRGYAYTGREISERSVTAVVDKMNAHAELLEWDSNYVVLELDGRTYAAYFATN